MTKRIESQTFNQKDNLNNKSNKRNRTDDFNQSLYDNVVFSLYFSRS